MKDNLIETTKNFIQQSNVVIFSLERKIKEIAKHHEKSNFFRTIATSTSCLGAGLIVSSLLLAPFTGGTSVIAATGIGFAISLGGGAISLTTEIVDVFASKSFEKEYKTIVDKRSDSANKLNNLFETIKDMTNKMIKEGIAEEFATTAAFCAIKEGYNVESFSLKYQEIKELSVKMKSEFRLGQKECFLAAIFAVNRGISIVNFGKSLNTIKSVIQTARGLGNFSLRNGGKFWMGMRQLANSLFPNLGKTVGMTIVRNGFVVLTAGLAIYDIISTSESWKNNHPTGAAIEDAILIMKEEINNFEALIDFLEKELQ